MAIDKLNIPNKTDNAAKKKMVASNEIGTNETLLANEVNALIAKTNELVDAYNFGAPITAFNFKTNVPTYTDLPTEGNEVNDGYGVIEDGLVYVWNGTAFPPEGDGMNLGLKPNGEVGESNPFAVSGGEIYEKTVLNADLKTKSSSSNLLNPKYIKTGVSINSTGVIQNTSTGVSVIGIPLSELTETFTVSGHIGNASRFYSFMDDNDLVVQTGNTNGSSKTFITPPGATKFNILLGSTTEDTSKVMFNEDSFPLPHEPFTQFIERIKDIKILPESVVTSEDIDYMDLSILDGVNLFDKTNIVLGYGLNGSGNSFSAPGAAHSVFIKVRPSSSIFIRKLEGSPVSGFFYSEPNESAGYKAGFTIPTGTSGFITTTPSTNYIRFNIYGTTTPDVQSRLDSYMISMSSVPIDYVPYKKYLLSIKDVEFYSKDNSTHQNKYSFPANITNTAGVFKDKQQKQLDANNQLIQIAFFGDSWTDRVPNCIYYVQEVCNILRERLGYGGAGWYDFAHSQGNASSQKMACADLRDVSDSRVGPANYVDGTNDYNSKGINMAHGEFSTGFKIILTFNQLQEIGHLHFFGGSQYGVFSYKIGSEQSVLVDTSTYDGYQTIDNLNISGITHLEVEILSGTCIILGVNLLRSTGVVVHKFGNRSTGVYQYQSIDIDNWKLALSKFNIDSAILMLGGLDWTHNHTPSRYRQSLDFWVEQFREIHTYADFAFVAQSELKLTGKLYTMEEFAEKMYQCAVDNSPEIGFLSLVPLFGSREKIIAKNLFYDDTHPTTEMGRVIASEIVTNFYN